jgi:hypothetical protein
MNEQSTESSTTTSSDTPDTEVGKVDQAQAEFNPVALSEIVEQSAQPIADPYAPKGSEANPLNDQDAAADLAGEPRPVPQIIMPTVGRKVWFFPNGACFHSNPYCINPEVPMDADVVFVWGERMVNLTVKDHIGQVHAFTSVTLLQPGDEIPAGGYARWMPFQIGQAIAAA